ncbi:hypothetical protein SAMN04487957_104217 [Halomonas shengliensis]|uniref:Uncharacterized protein n=1 Tax=Halomonas shengliensis TaxID=419597 RepID=A0A1H0HLP3_9GAMM|nr:hypothetical protein [Halomonas shengliensis]SDO19974.1 hypothetical protein SAMN04487957_104217 [Halomonas shengliensis]
MKHFAEFVVAVGGGFLFLAWIYTTLPILLDGHWIVAALMTGGFSWAMNAVLDIGKTLTPKPKRDPADDP